MNQAPPAKPAAQSVFLYKKQLLVARFDNTPGVVATTLNRTDDTEATACAWGSGQCLSTEWEPDILKGVDECESFDEFIRRMKYFKYRVESGEPRMVKRRFSRL